MDEKLIQQVTAAVLEIMSDETVKATSIETTIPALRLNGENEFGIFKDVKDAVAGAKIAYEQLQRCSIEQRSEMIESIKNKVRDNIDDLVRSELSETGFGRLEHKKTKFLVAMDKTPGIEDIMPQIISGDNGMTITEYRPFGIAACITPSTAPAATVAHNAICMIAAGNVAVISPHPGAINTTMKTVSLVNEAIAEVVDIKNIICAFENVSMENSRKLMSHEDISIVVATGGPGVVKEALSSGKKAIGAGAGNPPCLIDETADIKKAASDVISGNSNENGINCIGEKAVVVVREKADQLIEEMKNRGGYLLRGAEIDNLTKLVTNEKGMPNKKFVGKSAAAILKELGIIVDDNIYRSIIFEVPADHIIVMEEYLMPILPIVRVHDFEEGVDLAVVIEGGRRHTAVIHSKNIDNMARYAKKLSTTILVKNGASYNGTGIGGEGHITLTIAGPTGEGLTTPRTFTRTTRCALIGNIGLRGAL